MKELVFVGCFAVVLSDFRLMMVSGRLLLLSCLGLNFKCFAVLVDNTA